MPKGPKGEKRPADVIGNAVMVMRIAKGEEENSLPSSIRTSFEIAKSGGNGRAEKISAKVRSEIARKATEMRWVIDESVASIANKISRGTFAATLFLA